jgi:hypothetical protein
MASRTATNDTPTPDPTRLCPDCNVPAVRRRYRRQVLRRADDVALPHLSLLHLRRIATGQTYGPQLTQSQAIWASRSDNPARARAAGRTLLQDFPYELKGLSLLLRGHPTTTVRLHPVFGRFCMLPDPPPKLLSASLRDTPEERRQHRLAPDPCAACGHKVHVMLRTPYVLYMRCDRCLAMWSVAKPGYEREFGT